MTRCGTCGHEVSGDKHHGNHSLDMHHAPAGGPVPVLYSFAEWRYSRGRRTHVIAILYRPDGTTDTRVSAVRHADGFSVCP